MGFRLVPKSVALNDPEQRNGPCFALVRRIFVYDVVAKQLLGLPRFQNILLIVYESMTILKRCRQLFSDYLSKTN